VIHGQPGQVGVIGRARSCCDFSVWLIAICQLLTALFSNIFRMVRLGGRAFGELLPTTKVRGWYREFEKSQLTRFVNFGLR
jgi:hypothetical protein